MCRQLAQFKPECRENRRIRFDRKQTNCQRTTITEEAIRLWGSHRLEMLPDRVWITPKRQLKEIMQLIESMHRLKLFFLAHREKMKQHLIIRQAVHFKTLIYRASFSKPVPVAGSSQNIALLPCTDGRSIFACALHNKVWIAVYYIWWSINCTHSFCWFRN